MKWKGLYKKMLLGLGFDAKDGHKRVTKGENFYLFGGSKQTHQVLQEKAIKFNEQLEKKGKTLDEASEKEIFEIADKIGLKRVEDDNSSKKESLD